jgi:hypothetical protein
MSRSRSFAAVLLSAAMVAFLVIGVGSPAQANDRKRSGSDVSAINDSQAQVQVSQTQTQSTPQTSGQTGYTGSTGYTGTGTPSGVTGAPAEECGRYLGSTFVTEVCPEDPADPADPTAPVAPVITAQMVTAAAVVTAPVNPPNVEPGTKSFVNIPNNYWAETPTVDDAVTLLGTTIPLRWTPVSTTWSFGDGGSEIGNGIEGAGVGAPGAVEHAYQRQGSYDITTTTTYDLTFVLPGGAAQTIQLTAPPSPAVTLPVREIQTFTDWVS